VSDAGVAVGWPERALGFAAGLAGASGVGAAAAAVHGGSAPNLETAARFLLFHAPALLALSATLAAGTVGRRLGRLAGAALVIGLALFSGDLALQALRGVALFPMAAPSGGMLLIGGWLLAGVASLAARRR
jgi:uncharacterized membrane protein YgdD (TMEM256/DUF423 family)